MKEMQNNFLYPVNTITEGARGHQSWGQVHSEKASELVRRSARESENWKGVSFLVQPV